MPVIKFTTADVLRSKNLEAGWYSFQVKTITGPTANSEKNGINYEATCVLIDSANPDLNGKELSGWFGFKNGKGWGLDFVAATLGKSLSEIENLDIDTDLMMAAKFDGKVKIDVYEGRQNNKLDGYLPYKKAAGQGVPF